MNSLFQRLRKNLLLFLQLLIVFLGMLALAGPRWNGLTSAGERYVLAIDESASMGATDVAPSRLDEAKRLAKQIIDNMASDDLAMIVAFSDRARVVSAYSASRDLLRKKIDAISLTENSTNLREALQVIAGLAIPSSDREAREGVVVTAAQPPKLSIFTDGGFPDVEGFSVGKIDPEVVVIGPALAPMKEKPKPGTKKPPEPSDNVAILALSSARNEEKPDQFQVFGRVKNFRADPVKTEAKLIRRDPSKPKDPGTLIDAVSLSLDPMGEQSFQFNMKESGLMELEVRLDVKDALELDNRAFTVFGNPRKAQILLVTIKNRYLTDTLLTSTAAELAEVTTKTPEEAKTPETLREVGAGKYDLVIYDGVRPETAPEANALYFGVMPPGKAFEKTKVVESPVVVDWDMSHPLMQYIRDLGTIAIRKAITCEPPNGSQVLIDSDGGPLAFVVPRVGYVDAVIGFGLLDGSTIITNWPARYSFPLFLYNALRFLGNARDSTGHEAHLPDQPVILRADSTADAVEVSAPSGILAERIKRSAQGTFVFNSAKTTGIYHVRWGKDMSSSFAVNLFDPRESDIAPRGMVPSGLTEDEAKAYQINIGHTPVSGKKSSSSGWKDSWTWIAMGMLGIVLLEWYIYNRRVYV